MDSEVELRTFSNEAELDWMIKTFRQELAEPYSIFTYLYFLKTWPNLAVMAYMQDKIVGCIIGNIDEKNPRKAYIGMLVVEKEFRRFKIGLKLFKEFYARVEGKVDKIVLETECNNSAALGFYRRLGFFQTRRMPNYYLGGTDAYRLKLYIRSEGTTCEEVLNNKSIPQHQEQAPPSVSTT